MITRFYPQTLLAFFLCFSVYLTAQIPSINPVDPKFGADFIITAKLSGDQEVPAVTTDAVGVATVHFSPDRTMATLNVTVSNLSSAVTGAHIHKGAVGTNGSIVLDFSGDYSNGRITKTFPVDAARIAEFIKGELYLNIHTANNGGGELRGQLLLEAPESFMGTLSGDQENPAVTTNATGVVSVHYTANTNVLEINAQWDGLSSAITMVHLHEGAVGVNGGVVLDLSSSVIGNSIKVKVAGNDVIAAMRAGNIYLNVHTQNHGGGEIRAQLMPQEGLIIDTWLTAAQETHAVTNGANSIGLGFFKIAPTLDQMDYKVQMNRLTGAIAGAHLHNGGLGQNGSVEQGLTISGNVVSANNLAISADLLASILSGKIYVNIHTAQNSAGEVRGQLYRLARDGYTYDICPQQEIPTPMGADTMSGSGMFAFNREMTEAHLMVTVNQLSSAFSGSHIHQGAAGATGPVIFNFTNNFANGGAFLYFTDTSSTPFNAAFAETIRTSNAYVNIHTANNPPGEVRGQIVKAIAEQCVGCQPNITLSGTITGAHKASSTITTNGTTTTSGNAVNMRAGTSITLNNGFSAVSGVPFSAVIGSCLPAPPQLVEAIPVDAKLESPNLSAVKFDLFPNPTVGLTTITYQLEKPQPVFLAVYNLTGQVMEIVQQIEEQTAGNHQVQLQVGDYEPGMYMVLWKTNDKVQSKKLLVGK